MPDPRVFRVLVEERADGSLSIVVGGDGLWREEWRDRWSWARGGAPILGPDLHTLVHPEDWAKLADSAERLGARLAIVDSLTHLAGAGVKLNDREAAYATLEKLRPLREREIAVLLLSHAGHGAPGAPASARPSGSVHLMAEPRVLIEMNKPLASGDQVLNLSGNEIATQRVRCRMDFERRTLIRVDDDAGTREAKAEAKERQRLTDAYPKVMAVLGCENDTAAGRALYAAKLTASTDSGRGMARTLRQGQMIVTGPDGRIALGPKAPREWSP